MSVAVRGMERPETSEEAQAHIAEIRGRKGFDAKSGDENCNVDDLEAALDILSAELYQQSTHFLLELIQNADDCSYDNCSSQHKNPTIDITYWNNRLRIDYNEDGIKKSTKQTTESKIGEKGIGFKSVFRMANVVWINSQHYSFQFDKHRKLGMITPTWVDFPVPRRDNFTSILLQVPNEDDRKDLAREMKSLTPKCLMFLRRIRQINIRIDAEGDEGYRTSLARNDELSKDRSRRSTRLQHDDQTLSYYVIQHDISGLPWEPKRMNQTQSTIELAFPTTIDLDEPVIESQQVYAFLPVRDYGFKFLLHADFLLTANRQDIATPSNWNNVVVDCVEDAFMKAVHLLNDSTLRYKWPRYLPIPLGFSNVFSDIRMEKLRQSPVLESEDSGWITPQSARFVPASFRDDFNNPLISTPKTRSRNLSRNYDTADWKYIENLGVKILSDSELIDDVREFYTNSDLITSYSEQDHSRLAGVLESLFPFSYFRTTLQEIPLIPLNDGRWVAMSAGQNEMGVIDKLGSFWVATKGGSPRYAREVYLDAPWPHSASKYINKNSIGVYFLDEEYLYAVQPDEMSSWLMWLHKELEMWHIPRLDDISRSLRNISTNPERLANAQISRELLVLLRDNWGTYKEYFSQDYPPVVQEFSSARVKCLNDEPRKLCDTITVPLLPDIWGPKIQNLHPILDISEPKSTRWEFLTTFGVTVRDSIDFYLSTLDKVRGSEVPKEFVAWLYDNIQSRIYKDNLESVKQLFKKNSIYIPSSTAGVGSSWVKESECVWNGMEHLQKFHVLKRLYPSNAQLFKNILKHTQANLEVLVSEAKQITVSTSISWITQIFKEINKALCSKRYDATGLRRLDDLIPIKVFPIREGDTEAGYENLSSGTADKEWYIADRPHLQQSFHGVVYLLAFTVEDVLEMIPLIKALKLESRLLSKRAVSTLKTEGNVQLHVGHTTAFREKAKFISYMLSKHNPRREQLRSALENTKVFVADQVLVRWAIKCINADSETSEIQSSRTDDGLKGVALLSPNNEEIEVYLRTKNDTNIPVEVAEQLATICDIDRRAILIYYVLSNSDHLYISDLLARNGIMTPLQKMRGVSLGDAWDGSQESDAESEQLDISSIPETAQTTNSSKGKEIEETDTPPNAYRLIETGVKYGTGVKVGTNKIRLQSPKTEASIAVSESPPDFLSSGEKVPDHPVSSPSKADTSQQPYRPPPPVEPPLPRPGYIWLGDIPEISSGTPRNDGEELQGDLRRVSLDSINEKFQAMSYVWGQALKPFTLKTTQGNIGLTAPLYFGLQRLRWKNASVLIWADAICIDQGNSEEKSHQIRLMPEIFKSAGRVCVWLGEEAENSDKAIKCLREIGARPGQPPDSAFASEEDWDSINRFFGRPWFRRVWIVQELVLAQKVTMLCGKQKAQWSEVYNAAKICSERAKRSTAAIMKPIAQQAEAILSLGELKQSYHEEGGQRELLALFDRFQHTRATLQRDKLFAFLGLARDADDPDLDPDYVSPLDVIVRRYGRTFVKRGGALNLLYRAGYSSPRFPSWIPDWVTNVQRQTITTWPSRRKGFSASTRLKSDIVLSPGRDVLVARGYVLDTIERVGQVSSDRTLYLKEIFQAVKSLKSYPSKDKLEDLVWKIPIGDADKPISGTWEEVNFRTSYEAFVEYLQLGEKMTDWETEVKEMSAMYRIKQFLFRPQELRKSMWPFLYTAQEFAERFTNAKVCVTKAGYVGIVPGTAKDGDTVALFHGSAVPFLLRKRDKQHNRYFHLGECYIHGIMHGERHSGQALLETGFELY
ncbi:hypothetical protein GQX73_g2789 [Xylaria multiplex]|uniref:Heterokaryon incompatibility domain-containing protein n=1 Tax=Xylaria multiplex TaxID=323545 RepID=A0A7C8IWL7_9PEZI|nr:hypothetical protein GQX73_g2789 [Xylaria multiplex]